MIFTYECHCCAYSQKLFMYTKVKLSIEQTNNCNDEIKMASFYDWFAFTFNSYKIQNRIL